MCLSLSCSNNTIPKISLGTRMMIGKGGNNISHVSAADISFITSYFADNKSQQKYSINWGHLVPPNGNIHVGLMLQMAQNSIYIAKKLTLEVNLPFVRANRVNIPE